MTNGIIENEEGLNGLLTYGLIHVYIQNTVL